MVLCRAPRWGAASPPNTETLLRVVHAGVLLPLQLLRVPPEVLEERGADDRPNLPTPTGLDVSVDLPIVLKSKRILAVAYVIHQALQRGVDLIEVGHVGVLARRRHERRREDL